MVSVTVILRKHAVRVVTIEPVSPLLHLTLYLPMVLLISFAQLT